MSYRKRRQINVTAIQAASLRGHAGIIHVIRMGARNQFRNPCRPAWQQKHRRFIPIHSRKCSIFSTRFRNHSTDIPGFAIYKYMPDTWIFLFHRICHRHIWKSQIFLHHNISGRLCQFNNSFQFRLPVGRQHHDWHRPNLGKRKKHDHKRNPVRKLHKHFISL